ncbi:hypothetical protein DSECCO2_281620 [anaerobic digester metagenome]
MRFLPAFNVTQRFIAVTHSMRLNIGFINYIYSEAVAQTVKIWIVWIMACSYGVDIKLFEQFHVPEHGRLGNSPAIRGINIVTVNSLDLYTFSVHPQLLIFYLYFPKTKIGALNHQNLASLIFGNNQNMVKIGIFCRPEPGITD